MLLFNLINPSTAYILSFLTFAAGFTARPVGGIIFGHFGDQIGRKKTLVMALLLMGISSTLIGLLPPYAMIGVAAPILLTILRFAQGLAIGGQWGGAMLLVTESAPDNKRGYYGAYAQAGAPVVVFLANLAFIFTSAMVSEEFFMTWGWRIPFLASVVLIGISMYIQLNLEDTKAFRELENSTQEQQESKSSAPIISSPILQALRKYPKRIKTIVEIIIIIFFVLLTKKTLIFSFLVFSFIIAVSSSIVKSYSLKRTEVFPHFYNILIRF